LHVKIVVIIVSVIGNVMQSSGREQSPTINNIEKLISMITHNQIKFVKAWNNFPGTIIIFYQYRLGKNLPS
jgi:hypothetical protein